MSYEKIRIEGCVVGGISVKDLNLHIDFGKKVWIPYAWMEKSKDLKWRIDSGALKIVEASTSDKIVDLSSDRKFPLTRVITEKSGDISQVQDNNQVILELRKLGEKLDAVIEAVSKIGVSVVASDNSRFYGTQQQEEGPRKKDPIYIPELKLDTIVSKAFKVEEVTGGSSIDAATKALKTIS